MDVRVPSARNLSQGRGYTLEEIRILSNKSSNPEPLNLGNKRPSNHAFYFAKIQLSNLMSSSSKFFRLVRNFGALQVTKRGHPYLAILSWSEFLSLINSFKDAHGSQCVCKWCNNSEIFM